MANWFDLPAEVKQIIFSFVPESEAIIYVPRDRRRKVDLEHLNSHHFHDLLLVSKSFITPNEFAFAVLSRASLVFHSPHGQRRFATEVNVAVREAVRSLHYARHISISSHTLPTEWRDSFEDFSNIATTLSTQFPQLKHIGISTHPYCADIGTYTSRNCPSLAQFDQMVGSILYAASGASLHVEHIPDLIAYVDALPYAMADCIANRNTSRRYFAWTRPVHWLRRLVQYADEAAIEIVFDIDLCIKSTFESPYAGGSDSVPLVNADLCFAHRYRSDLSLKTWLMHVRSSMSTKDYLLRVEHDSIEYKFHQKLAYDLLHAPASKSDPSWRAIFEKHGYRPRRRYL